MKKFTTLLMTCLIMLVVVLTGCSTFRIDKVKYYNEVLARVGNENITRFDLINAYNSYGYTNYVTQQGQSETEALISTMNTIVQRKLVAKHAMDNQDKYALTQYEVKKLYRDTVDALLSSVEDNKETARRIYNLELTEEESDSDETKETFKMSEFAHKKRVKVVDGQIKYQNTNTDKDADEVDIKIDNDYVEYHKNYTKAEIVKQLLNVFKKELYLNAHDEDVILYKKVCDKTIELTCNNLINYEYYLREDGKKLSTTENDLLFRFVERTYESYCENAYVTKVNNVYLQTEELSNESIINAYKALYESDYAKYKNNSSYNDKIIESNGDLIYYAPDGDAKFGYFLHVLLPLNNVEDDMTWLKEHRDIYTDEQYQAEQLSLINQIRCAQRSTEDIRDEETGELIYEEGVTLEGEVSIQEALEEYAEKVKDINSFKEFMFKYTTDTATLTADMPYIIGYNAVTDEEYSSMVSNFTKEAIRLMKEGQSNSAYSDADEYILSNYGVHLLYYVGPVNNKIKPQDINKVTINQLDSAMLNEATGESYLDRVFDLVYPADSTGMFTSNTKYSSYEKTLVDSLYAKYPVKIYETKVKASNKI